MAVRYLNATGAQALIDAIKSRLSTKASNEDVAAVQNQLETLRSQLPTKTSDLQNDSGFLTSETASELFYSKTLGEQLQTIVQQNQNAIDILNADDSVEGSVDYKIAQAGGGNVLSIPAADIRALF